MPFGDGAQHGAATAQHLPRKNVKTERDCSWRFGQQSFGTVQDTDDLGTKAVHGPFDHGADRGVQAGAIATTGKNADSFHFMFAQPKLLLQGSSFCYPVYRQSHLSGTMEDEDTLKKQLENLQLEHRDLDDVIDLLIETRQFDQLQIQRLKKRKLSLKDQIIRLESRILPDIIA